MVTHNVAQYPLHYVAYAPAKFEVATSNRLGDATKIHNLTSDLDLAIKATLNIAQCTLHHVT